MRKWQYGDLTMKHRGAECPIAARKGVWPFGKLVIGLSDGHAEHLLWMVRAAPRIAASLAEDRGDGTRYDA